MASTPTASGKPADWIHAYTRDFSGDEFKRLFTHDTRDAYDFFTRGRNGEAYAKLPWWKQLPLRFRQFMIEQRGEVIPVPVTITLLYTNGNTERLTIPVTERSVTRTLPLTGTLRELVVNQEDSVAVFDR